MKTIKEAELREIIQEELVNELFGLFKKKKQNKKMYFSKNDRVVLKFLDALKQAKKEIIEFKTNPKKPNFSVNDDLRLYDYTSKAIDGYELFANKVFPIISSISGVLKENKIKYEQYKYPLHIGYTFYEIFSKEEIINTSDFTLRKLAKDYFIKLQAQERKEILSLMMFYRRIFVYMKQNDLIEFLANQFGEIVPDYNDTMIDNSDTTRDDMEFNSNISRPVIPGQKPKYLSQVSSAKK